MKQIIKTSLFLSILITSLVLLTKIGLPYNAVSFTALFANPYAPDEPILQINYTDGKPGSYFTLTGSGYPVNSTATISVNGTNIGEVQTDDNGTFVIELNTGGADVGAYFVTVTVNPSATVRFMLDASSPTRPSEGIGTSFDVPAGIAFTEFVYLPLIQR